MCMKENNYCRRAKYISVTVSSYYVSRGDTGLGSIDVLRWFKNKEMGFLDHHSNFCTKKCTIKKCLELKKVGFGGGLPNFCSKMLLKLTNMYTTELKNKKSFCGKLFQITLKMEVGFSLE